MKNPINLLNNDQGNYEIVSIMNQVLILQKTY